MSMIGNSGVPIQHEIFDDATKANRAEQARRARGGRPADSDVPGRHLVRRLVRTLLRR